MSADSRFLEKNRIQAWALGERHREDLVQRYMEAQHLKTRPFLKDVIDDLIEDVQGARLFCDPLPLDTYAQTEAVNGRVLVTINSRIAEIPGVKDAAGVAYVAKWHESIHVLRDVVRGSVPESLQEGLPAFEVMPCRVVVCRAVGRAIGAEAEREFIAENAALAAAVARADLRRCPAFSRLRELLDIGGDITRPGWAVLYELADRLGINISALVRYFEHRGLLRTQEGGGHQHLLANRGLLEWAEVL